MTTAAETINHLLKKYQHRFESVIDFNPFSEKIIPLDFTAANISLTAPIIDNTQVFTQYIKETLSAKKAKFGIGGFMEERTVYARSIHFNTQDGEPRRLHLGVDIWGAAETPVYAFMDANVHSFAFNGNFGDYGATIILSHILENKTFFSLYGHLSLKNLEGLHPGKFIKKGTHFCDFGAPEDNGHWPPHLHLQLLTSMEGKEGDYPGVVKVSEKEIWLQKIPNANLILNWI